MAKPSGQQFLQVLSIVHNTLKSQERFTDFDGLLLLDRLLFLRPRLVAHRGDSLRSKRIAQFLILSYVWYSFHINVLDCVFVFVFLPFDLGRSCQFLCGVLLQCLNEAGVVFTYSTKKLCLFKYVQIWCYILWIFLYLRSQK